MTEEERLSYEARLVALVESIMRRHAADARRTQRMAQACAEAAAQDDSGSIC